MEHCTLLIFARLVIFVFCVTLFALQSYQEREKFASGVTSTAILTILDENLNYPDFVICPARAHRRKGRIRSLEIYKNITFSKDEIIQTIKTHGKDSSKLFDVTELYTLYRGTCFLIRPNKNISYDYWITIM